MPEAYNLNMKTYFCVCVDGSFDNDRPEGRLRIHSETSFVVGELPREKVLSLMDGRFSSCTGYKIKLRTPVYTSRFRVGGTV